MMMIMIPTLVETLKSLCKNKQTRVHWFIHYFSLSLSDLGITLMTAVTHPELLRTLCELFPYSFSSMLIMIHMSDMKKTGPIDYCDNKDKPGVHNDTNLNEDNDDGDDKGWMGKEKSMKKAMMKKNMDKAQIMATETPWEFGFKQVMTISIIFIFGHMCLTFACHF